MTTQQPTRRLTAAQLCRQHPECRPMEPIHQCSGHKTAMVQLFPGQPRGPRVRGTVPCGKVAQWRVFNPNRYRGTLPPGFCTPHAAAILREHDAKACPERAPLAAAKDAAWRAYTTNPSAAQERALRAANTVLGEHDRTHACPMSTVTTTNVAGIGAFTLEA